MAPNEHLLDNFSPSKETRTLSAQILRLAQAKTGPGSGRELGELRVGLAAASILIACERLNNTEVNKKAAQIASCLKDRDFKKVYDTVRTIVDEHEKATTPGKGSPSRVAIHGNEPTELGPGRTPTRRSSRITPSTTPGKDSPSRVAIPGNEPTQLGQDRTPTRRSSRTTPSIYGTQNSPTKSHLPPPWKKGPIRELPTKGSPKKQIIADGPSQLSTPSKPPTVVIKVPSPLKRSYAVAISTSESDESESEDWFRRGRFRPVYVEQRQWTAQDPLVASIWRKAEKSRARQDGLKTSARRKRSA